MRSKVLHDIGMIYFIKAKKKLYSFEEHVRISVQLPNCFLEVNFKYFEKKRRQLFDISFLVVSYFIS